MEEGKVGNTVNIVVAVDESQESMRACRWVCAHLLATQTNVRQSYNFTLLHVQPPLCVSTGPAYILSSKVFYHLELDAKRATQRVLTRALHICNYYNVKADTYVVTGEAKEKICEAVQKLETHILVMGSHGHGPFIRAIKGSVSDYCSRNAMCPLLLVNKKVS